MAENIADYIQRTVPMIAVPDISKAMAWYLSIGFEEIARHEEDGVIDFGMVGLGNAELMFRPCESFGVRDTNVWLSRDVSLWFYTNDVDQIYQVFKSLQIELAEDLYEPFYGGRQFSIRDLNGYILIFLQPAAE
jgi:uncharacterized glyoxalase superfamily protein PhnB